MPQNTDVSIPARTWTSITVNDVTAIRAVNLGTSPILLMATVGATPPVSTAGAIPLMPKEVLAADLTLAQLWPGTAGANRVYAYADAAVAVSVSHA